MSMSALTHMHNSMYVCINTQVYCACDGSGCINTHTVHMHGVHVCQHVGMSNIYVHFDEYV